MDDLVKDYNKTVHSSIKMTPIKASKLENELIVYKHLYREKSDKTKKAKFKVENRARIAKQKGNSVMLLVGLEKYL